MKHRDGQKKSVMRQITRHAYTAPRQLDDTQTRQAQEDRELKIKCKERKSQILTRASGIRKTASCLMDVYLRNSIFT